MTLEKSLALFTSNSMFRLSLELLSKMSKISLNVSLEVANVHTNTKTHTPHSDPSKPTRAALKCSVLLIAVRIEVNIRDGCRSAELIELNWLSAMDGINIRVRNR